MTFPSAGTYLWTARGRKDGVWWQAPEVRTLVVCTNHTGAAMLLATPAHGSVSTNAATWFSVVPYGPGFAITDISIDNGVFASASFPTSMVVNPGMHTWTARGWSWPGPVCTYAQATNTFTVIDSAASSVILVAPADGTALEQDYVFFDLLRCNVGSMQLSTNNGMDWFAYQSPLAPPKGRCQWTARGTNSAGEWVYAAATNTVHLYDPAITIATAPTTVTFDVTSYVIAGAANTYVVGGLQWSNALNGAADSVQVSSFKFQVSGIPLGIGPNPIAVSGTNAWGVPEPAAIMTGMLMLALHRPRRRQ